MFGQNGMGWKCERLYQHTQAYKNFYRYRLYPLYGQLCHSYSLQCCGNTAKQIKPYYSYVPSSSLLLASIAKMGFNNHRSLNPTKSLSSSIQYAGDKSYILL